MKPKPRNLQLSPDLCTACRACELACHYHHQGTFGTSSSSMCIDFDGATGAIRMHVDLTCDGCVMNAEPCCFLACKPGAIGIG